jgi:hypothetical protein
MSAGLLSCRLVYPTWKNRYGFTKSVAPLPQRVREGRTLFGVPRRPAHREFLLLDQVCRQQSRHRVERKERRRGARNQLSNNLYLVDMEWASATEASMRDYYSGERRQEPRIYLPFPAIVEGINSEGEVFHFRTILDDFSAIGLRLRVSEKVRGGSKMKVTVRFSAIKRNRGEIMISGEVIRVIDKPGCTYEVAIKIGKHQFL